MANQNIPRRDQWFFIKDKSILKDKDALTWFHFNMALIKTLSMFEYENLPKEIPVRELEKIIQLNGFALMKKVDNKFYAFYGGLGGRPNEYYQPTEFIVANPYLKYYEVVDIQKEEGVLCWNDYSHMGLTPMIQRYAELMAECDITLRFGLINARILSILYSNNDTVKDSAQAFLNDVEDGKKLGVVMGEEWKDDNGDFNVSDYKKANGSDLKAVMELQQYLKASFFNDIGLQANYNMKREAINDSEAGMNEESLKPFVDNMLLSRQEAWDKFNAKYGENVKVKLSSSWVRREKIASDETEEEQPKEKKESEVTNE